MKTVAISGSVLETVAENRNRVITVVKRVHTASYKGTRASWIGEFNASNDTWFRTAKYTTWTNCAVYFESGLRPFF